MKTWGINGVSRRRWHCERRGAPVPKRHRPCWGALATLTLQGPTYRYCHVGYGSCSAPVPYKASNFHGSFPKHLESINHQYPIYQLKKQPKNTNQINSRHEITQQIKI